MIALTSFSLSGTTTSKSFGTKKMRDGPLLARRRQRVDDVQPILRARLVRVPGCSRATGMEAHQSSEWRGCIFWSDPEIRAKSRCLGLESWSGDHARQSRTGVCDLGRAAYRGHAHASQVAPIGNTTARVVFASWSSRALRLRDRASPVRCPSWWRSRPGYAPPMPRVS